MLKLFSYFSRRFSLTHLLLLVLVGGLLFTALPEIALAASDVPDWTSSEGWTTAAKFINDIAYWVVGGIVFLISFISIGVGALMDSTFIYDGGMGETLYVMWSTIRDFVNIGFILVLLVLAVIVILGPDDSGGLTKLKQILPKLILGLILVNFTFFGTRVVLTTSDVLATAIFTIPGMVDVTTIADSEKNDKPMTTFCNKVVNGNVVKGLTVAECMTDYAGGIEFFLDEDGKLTTKAFKDLKPRFDKIKERRAKGTITVNKLREKFDKQNAMFSTLLYMMHTVDLQNIKSDQQNVSKIVGSLFSMGLAIMLAVLIVAMFLGLVVRLVILWVLIAVSPLLVLGWVLKELVPQAGESLGGLELDKQFISNAFLPVFIAAPLALGFTMIFAANAYTPVTGLLGATEGATVGFLKLVWLIAAFIVIWMGTFGALKKGGEAVSMVTEKIKGGAEAFAGGAMKTLSYMPIIPGLSKDGSLSSLGSVTSAPSKIQGMLAGQADTRSRELAKPFASAFGLRPGEFRRDSAFEEDVNKTKANDVAGLAAAIKTHHDDNGTNVVLTADLKDKLGGIAPSQKTVINNSTDLASLLGNTQFRALLAKDGGEAGKEISSKHVAYAGAFKERQQEAKEAAKAAPAVSLALPDSLKGHGVDQNQFNSFVSGLAKAKDQGAVVTAINKLGAKLTKTQMIDSLNDFLKENDDKTETARANLVEFYDLPKAKAGDDKEYTLSLSKDKTQFSSK